MRSARACLLGALLALVGCLLWDRARLESDLAAARSSSGIVRDVKAANVAPKPLAFDGAHVRWSDEPAGLFSAPTLALGDGAQSATPKTDAALAALEKAVDRFIETAKRCSAPPPPAAGAVFTLPTSNGSNHISNPDGPLGSENYPVRSPR